MGRGCAGSVRQRRRSDGLDGGRSRLRAPQAQAPESGGGTGRTARSHVRASKKEPRRAHTEAEECGARGGEGIERAAGGAGTGGAGTGGAGTGGAGSGRSVHGRSGQRAVRAAGGESNRRRGNLLRRLILREANSCRRRRKGRRRREGAEGRAHVPAVRGRGVTAWPGHGGRVRLETLRERAERLGSADACHEVGSAPDLDGASARFG